MIARAVGNLSVGETEESGPLDLLATEPSLFSEASEGPCYKTKLN